LDIIAKNVEKLYILILHNLGLQMNKSIFVIMLVGVIAAALIATATLANTDVSATHKNGHSEPPACDNSNGKASENNKHCVDDEDDDDDGGDNEEGGE
jgi:hypothetical protein